jgi:hypothetical protein
MTHDPPFITPARLVHYKFAILAATAFYGPMIERSHGRPVLVRSKKADALARALPEPERTIVEAAFAKVDNLQLALHGVHGTEQ